MTADAVIEYPDLQHKKGGLLRTRKMTTPPCPLRTGQTVYHLNV